ncbi:MAG: dCMP deaminase, partial [Thermoplasmata archaeon]|nr:dCMP deaminase [Thermoplasmata archaeon]
MDGERPSVDQYFMDMTHLVKSRGTCPRRQVGAVIVKGKRVLTTGYNGAPRNFPHPIDVGCLRDELNIPRGMVADICPCLHAEQNAILQAATTGVSIEGADLYCTTQPCTQCSRMVANCGMQRVIYEEEYPDPLAIGILTTAGVELWRWDPQAKVARRVENPNTFEQAQDELRRRHREGTLVPAPRPGQLPMHTGALPTMPVPSATHDE